MTTPRKKWEVTWKARAKRFATFEAAAAKAVARVHKNGVAWISELNGFASFSVRANEDDQGGLLLTGKYTHEQAEILHRAWISYLKGVWNGDAA